MDCDRESVRRQPSEIVPPRPLSSLLRHLLIQAFPAPVCTTLSTFLPA